MTNGRWKLVGGALGAMLLCAFSGAAAQESAGNTVIGPPQLKDFSLQPRERIVEQPAPQPQPPQAEPAEAAPPPQRAETRRPAAPPPAAEPRGEERSGAEPVRTAEQEAAAPPPAAEAPVEIAEAPAPPSAPAAAETPLPEAREGTPIWYFALPAAALAFLGVAMVRRRRRAADVQPAAAPTAPAAPPRQRPDPVPRPWLELSLKAERAAFTATEAELLFELEIANKGGSPAHNLRIDVKMFNAGADQDKEIGAFFKTAGRESTKLNLPGVEAGVTGVLQGRVTLPVDEMKAMRLDERLLFIPVVAVNALYDWGEGRTGQTSRSYLVGREASEAGEKMGAFRVDQGPRVWRTVGQREHKLKKRV